MKYKSSMEHCPYTCITTDEKALTNKDILNLLNEQDERIQELETKLNDVEFKDGTKGFDCTKLFESGLLELMRDYNLTWECVYTILLQEVSDGKNGFSYVPNVLLKKVLHELNGLNGLYASDNKEMLQPFKLDYTDLIKLMESVIEDE